MKKFEFRLESVLRLRDAQLTVQTNKLQQLLAEEAQLQRNLLSIADERKEAAAWIHRLSGATSAEMKAFSAFLLGSKSRESMLRQAIQSCEEDIAKQRGRTLLARRNQKLLLKLKSKRRFEWQAEFNKELEEIAQQAWQAAVHLRSGSKEDK